MALAPALAEELAVFQMLELKMIEQHLLDHQTHLGPVVDTLGRIARAQGIPELDVQSYVRCDMALGVGEPQRDELPMLMVVTRPRHLNDYLQAVLDVPRAPLRC